jgi:hypothetical protein
MSSQIDHKNIFENNKNNNLVPIENSDEFYKYKYLKYKTKYLNLLEGGKGKGKGKKKSKKKSKCVKECVKRCNN